MKHIILTTVLVITCIATYAQRPDLAERRERMQAHKVAYITDELDLTVQEAEKFWPIYNDYQKEEREIRQSLRENLKAPSTMSDIEALALLHKQLDRELQKLTLQREYVSKLEDVISGKKILLLFKAEKDFVRRMLREYRGKRE